MSERLKRKAALELQALHPADRRWILSRLPVKEQARMRALLEQASRFDGLAPEVLREELSSNEVAATVELPRPSELIARLDELTPAWAARVLRAVAHDHEDIYLSNCDLSRAHRVRDALAGLPDTEAFPPAMAEALGRYVAIKGWTASSGAAA